MKFVPRAEWGARPPRSASHSIAPRGTAIHWEGPRLWTSGFNHARCATIVRGIQNFHMDSKGWVDIAYSGLVCPEGYVFEGRGLGIRTAANGTNEANGSLYALCYLGGDGDPFTDAAKVGYHDGTGWLKQANGLWEPHSDLRATACPGNLIRDWISVGHPNPAGTSTGQDNDMTDEDRRKLNAVYALLTWGFVTPTTDSGHPDLTKPAFGPSGELTHYLRRLEARTKRIEKALAELEAAGATGGVSDGDKADIARAARDAIAAWYQR